MCLLSSIYYFLHIHTTTVTHIHSNCCFLIFFAFYALKSNVSNNCNNSISVTCSFKFFYIHQKSMNDKFSNKQLTANNNIITRERRRFFIARTDNVESIISWLSQIYLWRKSNWYTKEIFQTLIFDRNGQYRGDNLILYINFKLGSQLKIKISFPRIL